MAGWRGVVPRTKQRLRECKHSRQRYGASRPHGQGPEWRDQANVVPHSAAGRERGGGEPYSSKPVRSRTTQDQEG